MMLALAAAALGAGAGGGGSYDSIVANWGTLTCAYPTASASDSETITFSVGTTRTLRVTYTEVGSLVYKKNSGAYTPISTGGTFSVATGDVVYFNYITDGVNGTRTATVYDDTKGESIDTFNLVVSGWTPP